MWMEEFFSVFYSQQVIVFCLLVLFLYLFLNKLEENNKRSFKEIHLAIQALEKKNENKNFQQNREIDLPSDKISAEIQNFTQEIKAEIVDKKDWFQNRNKSAVHNIKELSGKLEDKFKELTSFMQKSSTEIKTEIAQIKQNQDTVNTEIKRLSTSISEANNTILNFRRDSLPTMKSILTKVENVEIMNQQIGLSGSDAGQTGEDGIHDVIQTTNQSTRELKIEITKLSTKLDEKIERVAEALEEAVDHIATKDLPSFVNGVKIMLEQHLIDHKEEIKNMKLELINDVTEVKVSTHLKIEQSQEKSTKNVQNFFDKELQVCLKNLTYFIEKESQLSREVARNEPPNNRSVYEFYFAITDFTRRQKSNVAVYSPPWYVEQFDSCLRGHAWFKLNGNICLSLQNGRYPKLVGLEPKPKKTFMLTACVVKKGGNKEHVLKDQTCAYLDESEQRLHCDSWGNQIGDFSCQQLNNDGFVSDDCIVIKYTITV